ncbi:hypothetical protein [Robertmurraya sp. Marseille-Q9965]
MSRYISISFLIFFGSMIIIFLLGGMIADDTFIFSFGTLIVLLLSIAISLLVRIIELLNKNR